jgi:RNA polymerase sigma factor (TIGR02999 family)
MTGGPHEVGALLSRVAGGDAASTDALLDAVYRELREMAERQLRRESPAHTLQPTALVHEAYLKLMKGSEGKTEWSGRAHFFAAAAQAMRRILVDHARGRDRAKRGGGVERVELSGVLGEMAAAPEVDLVLLDDALAALAREDETAAKIVDMRYFAGMEIDEIALVLGVSGRTVRRHWNFARAWLFREIAGGGA